ncbi:MAG: response regulator transcription factor [Nitrospira sp.]|nr:response regulator transcription factor [Nitrospira sp.]
MAVNAGSFTKVAIISGQSLIWIGLQTILESTHTFRIVGSPIQRLAAPEAIADYQPDVIIIDTETERDAIDGIKQLRDSIPHSKVMLLSGFEQKDPVREALEYGIDGVILKIHPPTVIIAAIQALCPSSRRSPGTGDHTVTYQELPIPFEVPTKPILRQPGWPDALTEREREVINLVEQGLSNKDIAHQLSISDSTVRHHLTSIFDKVGVPNRQKLMVHAHQLQVTPA